MNKFWIILSHTYINKLKSKSFIITTILSVAIVLGLTNMDNIIHAFDKNGGKDKVAVLDESGQLYEPFKQQLHKINKNIQLYHYNGSETEAEQAVKKGDYTGVIQLRINEEKLPEATYKAMSIADSSLYNDLQTGLQQLKTMIAASQINLSPNQLQKLYEPVSFKQYALEKNAKTEEQLKQARGLVYVLLFIIYFSVIMYASMIAMEVATEKSSRVMEILISSVSPIKQMFAKILGIGLLSLTQLAVFLSVGYYSFNKNMESLSGLFGFNQIPVATICYAVIFFILGYFLYATLAAFLGSLVSRIEDVQQMITPMTMLIVAGFMIAMFGLGKPDAPFITITSYIPFFTPMIMFLRVGMLNIPTWEAVIGIVIMLVTIVIFAIIGARIYRGGVLIYGKFNSYKDIKKALQLTKNE
ncbi:ABC transporter permease [Neobacillus massiliamazoniensis]|uniref:Sodium efflux ABC transporter permease NatB n=1 Tax=Neobacillus massiliamazoniensis TaxID=1499688 RepID=A0A0U1P000_9BACI|nr:ABC transporter permease [Neobacillus massiliamazoniensis]CRK83551.1 sodium efflux ABC transporter permease NatB [Neobacillus massiliamazoniensis]